MCLNGFAQNANDKVTITGKVVDKDGLGVVGLNVVEKGTKNGVLTDFDGGYKIQVAKGAVLQFSYIGMKTQEKTVGTATAINITMLEDSSSLNEVVVVGYGVQKKSHLTGAVESVKMDEIVNLPSGDVGAALKGRILGVSISGGEARPGNKSSLTIRKPYSLAKDGGNLNPLYVIDGVLQIGADGLNDSTMFDNLDSSEIESISFLKDAAAAIYGARSAQGVVIITTKKGKVGEPRFSYSGSYAVNDKIYQTKVLNAYEFGQYVNIMNGKNGYNQTSTDPQYFFSQDEMDYFKTLKNTFLDDEWSSSYNMRHNLNVSGGSEKATYFAGVSYFEQNGNLTTLDYNKWNFRSGVDLNLSNNWKTSMQISGYYSDKTKTFNKIGGENDENDYNELLFHVPYIPNYVNGMPIELLGNNDGNQRYHYGEIKKLNNLAETTESRTTINLSTEYKFPFIKGLSARASYARNMGSSRGSQFGTGYTLYQFTGLGANGHIFSDDITTAPVRSKFYENGNRLYFDNGKDLSEQYNFTGIYNRDFGKHNVSGLFSIEKSEATANHEIVWKSGVLAGSNGQFNTANGTIDGSTNKSESGNLAYVGRLNYAYGDKYLAEVLFRSDASTKFSPANYWGRFYSVSTGWVVSKEDFFKSSWVDFLKLRYSVGLLGKDDTKAWAWRQRYTFQTYKGAVFGGNSASTDGLKMEATPNPDATWSDEIKTNFGIDARFLNNRLSVTTEMYYNIGTNLLLNKTTTPFTIGGTPAAENFGAMDTYGYELSIGWNDKIGKDFKYGIDLRTGYSDNKLIKGNFESVIYPWTASQPGKSTNIGIWGYDYLGMFKNQADIDAYVAKYKITSVASVDGNTTYTPAQLKPGMLYYKDVRSYDPVTKTFGAPDGKIDQYDQVKLSNNRPISLGGTLRMSYKAFSLNTVFYASWGGWSEIDSGVRKSLKPKIPQIIDNTVSIWNDIYDADVNPDGKMPNPAFEANNSVISNFWRVNPFRVGIRNIQLSCGLPDGVLKALNLSSCKFNLVALNPFTIYNPYTYREADNSYNNYPSLRTFSLGLNVGF
jgi:TonB-linked SusC/RagA family outer membrane protein